jgi:transketolase N-terminal domain/subunit
LLHQRLADSLAKGRGGMDWTAIELIIAEAAGCADFQFTDRETPVGYAVNVRHLINGIVHPPWHTGHGRAAEVRKIMEIGNRQDRGFRRERFERGCRRDGVPGQGRPSRAALSITDIVATLYDSVLRIDPGNPQWAAGPADPVHGGTPAPPYIPHSPEKGYFSPSILPGLRALGSILQGHPVMEKTPGIDMTSGSLGNGLSIGVGMAIASAYTKKNFDVYVITGDGELQEGIVWEGALSAAKYRLGRLTVFVDQNGWQSVSTCDEIGGGIPIRPRFEAPAGIARRSTGTTSAPSPPRWRPRRRRRTGLPRSSRTR